MSNLRRRLLHALRHGAMNTVELADELNEAPFRVRGELRAMRRARLVTDRQAVGHMWELTDHGTRVAWADDQLILKGER